MFTSPVLSGIGAVVAAAVLLATVLAFAVLRPRGLPEALVAVPAAGAVLLLGLVSPGLALDQVTELGPTVAFLAAILLLGHLAAAEGVFTWLGGVLARRAGRRPVHLLGWVFAAAALVTAVLSLDATVVLLTPIVLATAGRLRLPARPYAYATAHLSNSASLLLPVSNLTNLLAFAASGLTFTAFAGLMAVPWLAVVAVEFLVLRRWFRRELRVPSTAPAAVSTHPALEPVSDPGLAPVSTDPPDAPPRRALVVLALTLAGFGVASAAGVEPVWVAAAGALALAVPALLARTAGVWALVRATDPLFCLFVLALGVVVEGVTGTGAGDVLAAVLPTTTTLPALLAVAGIAAVLANVVNNIPATLVLLSVLGGGPAPGVVLAVLIGVNIGPNLTYAGSLATLLWRRVLRGTDAEPRLGEFTLLGLLTVPLCLVIAVVALWAGLQLSG